MNVVRKVIKRPWDGNGTPHYEDGVIVGSVVFDIEWCNVAKRIYDNPDTVWFEIPIAEIRTNLEDSEGNPV